MAEGIIDGFEFERGSETRRWRAWDLELCLRMGHVFMLADDVDGDPFCIADSTISSWVIGDR